MKPNSQSTYNKIEKQITQNKKLSQPELTY
jgi:hypothetical protein